MIIDYYSQACETIWRGGLKSRRFVSKRTAFSGNGRCLSNFCEFAPAHWIDHSDGVKYLLYYKYTALHYIKTYITLYGM